MSRDKTKALEIQSAASSVSALLHDVEGFEQQADRENAELHAVLYGKVADALGEAAEALGEAANLLDPDITVIDS